MGKQAEVSDKLRFTQTRSTGRTMRFAHDSFKGSSSTPTRCTSPPQEEMLAYVRAERDLHHWARFPFLACVRACLGCTVPKTRLPAHIYSTFKDNTSSFDAQIDWWAACLRLMGTHIYGGGTVDCPWPPAKPTFQTYKHSSTLMHPSGAWQINAPWQRFCTTIHSSGSLKYSHGPFSCPTTAQIDDRGSEQRGSCANSLHLGSDLSSHLL